MKISRRVKTGCALALAALLALPCVNLMQARAAGPIIQEDAPCKLTIKAGDVLADADEDLGVTVNLYKVADVDVSGNFTSLEGFEGMNFNVAMDAENKAEQWSTLAENAVDAIKKIEGLSEDAQGVVYKNHPAVIEREEGGEELGVGMYLVVPEERMDADDVNATVRYVFTPVLIALPSSLYTLNGTGSDVWEYGREISLKGEAEPLYGELEISKTLENYNKTLGQTTCVFQVEWSEDGKDQTEVTSITLDGAGKQSIIFDRKIRAGVRVKVTEIYSGASYASSDPSTDAYAVIVADEVVSPETKASVSFTNHYDGGNQGGYGVTNHFDVDGANWSWTTNPTGPTNPTHPE